MALAEVAEKNLEATHEETRAIENLDTSVQEGAEEVTAEQVETRKVTAPTLEELQKNLHHLQNPDEEEEEEEEEPDEKPDIKPKPAFWLKRLVGLETQTQRENRERAREEKRKKDRGKFGSFFLGKQKHDTHRF